MAQCKWALQQPALLLELASMPSPSSLAKKSIRQQVPQQALR
jgi:hypothetical protein